MSNKNIKIFLTVLEVISLGIFWYGFFVDKIMLMLIGLLCMIQNMHTSILYELKNKDDDEYYE